jgi:ATP-dependent helicase/nuclease subunit B
MLRVVTGRFHPHLESALLDHVQRAKAIDPFTPLAVLVPSKPLVERIRRLLAVEQGLSLLNVHLLTFHQLALHLSEEARNQAETAPPVQVVDELFFEQLVRHILRSRLPTLAPLQHLSHSSGTWGALWSTIRDLKDAGVDPAEALGGLAEGYFGEEDAARLQALFTLYAAVKETGKALQLGTPEDLAESLIPFVPASPFITTLRHVFYYGFYDLTQVQLSLFEAVSKTAPTTLFFPLSDQPTFRFARRFFNRSIQPLVPAADAVVRVAESQPKGSPTFPPAPTLTVRSVVGVEEELASTCRLILDLVETNGYRFEDIGVVARTLEPYRSSLQSIFNRHRVPFTTTIGCPLIHEPLCKTILQLGSLPLNDYGYRTVLDIVTSPFYRSQLCEQFPDHVRPDFWKLVVPALHITRGREEWERLKSAGRTAVEIETRQEESGAAGSLDVPQPVVWLLWQIVSELLDDCAALPPSGTIGGLMDVFQRLIGQHLRLPPMNDEAPQDSHESRLALVWKALNRVFSTLTQLEAIGDELTWAEFIEMCSYAVDRATVPFFDIEHRGVAVLDVMAARGVPFKSLIVLGLNDKVFPRYIREDPFLRDRHRRVLDGTMGFKIDEKLSGYEEEAVLFTLLQQAATQRLYLLFQRADNEGRALAPSPYLALANRLCGLERGPVEAIPRRLTDQVSQRPAIRMFLPPEHLAVWVAEIGQDAAPLMQALGRDADLFRHGMAALRRLEDDSPTLTPYDGVTGTLAPLWSRVMEEGLAPTPLERYARCPFQYFAADVLRVEPIRVPLIKDLDAALLGTVCHAALRRCYQQLILTGWPAEPVTDDTIAWCIHSAVEEVAAEFESTGRTGHYVLWELAKNMIVSLVSSAVDADQEAQAEDQFIPVAFEVNAEGTVPGLTVGEAGPLKIRGRVDRIDKRPGSDSLRIIDYKLKSGSAIKAEDRHLAQSALRGYRLQAPLYACLRFPGHPPPSQVQLFFLASHWSTPVTRSTFDAAIWSSEVGSRLRETLRTLVEGIQSGRFLIVPDGYCDRCEFRVSCRREHTPTWWRAYRSPESKSLRALRSRRVKDA